MKLIGDELPKLQQALLTAFPTPAALAQMVRGALDENLAAIAGGGNLTEVVFNLISWAETEGRLMELLTKALQANPGSPALAALGPQLIAALNERQPTGEVRPVDPFDACLLRGKRAFVNRKDLRKALRELAAEEGSRVLVVDGEPLSGKSYSLELITYLADILESYRVIWIDLKDEVPSLFGPGDLARSIALQMRLSLDSMPKQEEIQASRWARVLGEWITGQMRASGATWWVVLDSFNQLDPPLADATDDLIKYLAERAETTVPELRVVLLSYKGLLPPRIRGFVQRETIASIEQIDVKDFFECLFGQRGQLSDAAAVDQAVEAALSLIPPDDPERLYYLSTAIGQVAERLFAGEEET